MKINLIGLGKMGFNIGLQLIKHKHELFVFDLSEEIREKAEKKGMKSFSSIEELVQADNSNIYYIMVPANQAIVSVCDKLLKLLPKDSIVIDGGNSKYIKTVERYETFKKAGIHFIDVGTSGGQKAALEGLCLMVGGDQKVVEKVESLFFDLTIKDGYEYVGPSGAGHYVKMIHNGIEYGMMQAIAEGFDILSNSKKYNLNLEKVAKIYGHGSVIRSWLMDLVIEIFSENPELENVSDVVNSSGEGLWTLQEALALKISTPVLTSALMKRFDSEKKTSITGQILNSMRNKFGGHDLIKK